MNDDHDMTRHLPNAEAMPADFEQTEALPTLVDGVSEQASAVTQALPVEPTQTLPVAETEAMPVEKVAVPQTETKSLPVDSASTEKLSAEPLAAGAVSDESAAPVDDGQTETEPAADAFGSPAAASDQRTGDVPAGATTAGDVPDKGQPLAAAPSTARAPRNSLMPPRPSPRVIQSSPVRHLSRFRCTARSPRESMTDTDRTARMRVLHTPLRPVPGPSRARAQITCKCRGTCRCVRSSARQGRAPPH